MSQQRSQFQLSPPLPSSKSTDSAGTADEADTFSGGSIADCSGNGTHGNGNGNGSGENQPPSESMSTSTSTSTSTRLICSGSLRSSSSSSLRSKSCDLHLHRHRNRRYLLHNDLVVGRGSYGSVCIASLDPSVPGGRRKKFACKSVKLLPDPKYVSKLQEEVKILKETRDHQHIIHLRDVFCVGQTLYFITSLGRGGDLFHLLR